MTTRDMSLPGSFDVLLKTHDKPILVDFWAEWCGPCKMLSPVLEQLAKEWKGRITVIKINTDQKPEISSRYNISGIPTVIMFKNGKEVLRISGALPLPALKSAFERFI